MSVTRFVDLAAKIKYDASKNKYPPLHSQLEQAHVPFSTLGVPRCPECKKWDLRFFQSSQAKTSRLVRNPNMEILGDTKISVICIPCDNTFIFNIHAKKNVLFLDDEIFIANEQMLEKEIGYERS